MFGVLAAGLSSTLTDDFGRADSATVATAVPLAWQEVGPWEIASNRLRRAVGGDALDVVYLPPTVADGFAECVPLNFLIGPVVRWNTTVSGGYAVYHNVVETRLVKINTTSPTLTQLGTSSDLPDLATDALAIEAVGTSIRAYLNGSLIIEATDAVWTSGVRGIITIDDMNQVEADNYAEGE